MTGVSVMLLVFCASFAVGYALISRVPPLLHTPLMSMTNALSAVTILGALLYLGYLDWKAHVDAGQPPFPLFPNAGHSHDPLRLHG